MFTTRWAMSYLRGPLTRDQIKQVMGGDNDGKPRWLPATAHPAEPAAASTAAAASEPPPSDDSTPVMPTVAAGIGVRWVATTATWLGDIGGDSAGTVYESAILARVHLRYDEAKADLVYDVDRDALLFPLDGEIDAGRSADVAYSDADLLTVAPASVAYRVTSAPIGDSRPGSRSSVDSSTISCKPARSNCR